MGSLSSSFSTNLKLKYDELTDNDLKLASMIAMDMSNKEIAISKNISQDSVKKNKYRLKKKLNLSQDFDLKEYLRSYV